MFDNELLHYFESTANQTYKTQFQLGKALKHQDHDHFNKTVEGSPRSAATAFLALPYVVATF